jgi:DNA replication protein
MKRDRIIHMMQDTPFTFPAALFRYYKKLELTDMQFLVLQHIHQLRQEGVRLPSPQQIGERMTAPVQDCSRLLRELMSARFIVINETSDSNKDIIVEEISLKPVFEKLYEYLAAEEMEDEDVKSKNKEGILFEKFEVEFARPLTPMEMEMISMWFDEDGHDPELIEAALKEAVISSKLNFRYIDRILHDWKRNGVKTLDAAKQHGEKVRSHRSISSAPASQAKPHPGYNWLEGGKN